MMSAQRRLLNWAVTDIFKSRDKPDWPVIPPNKGMPVRVGFLVSEPKKWVLQSHFDEIAKHPRFEAGFYVTPSDVALRLARWDRASKHRKDTTYFNKRGSVWSELYDPQTDLFTDPQSIDCDILFIQQPWGGMQDLPRRLAARVRTAYVPYDLPVVAQPEQTTKLSHFYPYLWRHFQLDLTLSELAIGDNRRCIGHPIFDYDQKHTPPVEMAPDTATRRKRIIYAPHHSIGKRSLRLSTFRWSGAAMIKLVADNPHYDFILRAHPNTRYSFQKVGIDYDSYCKTWESHRNASIDENTDFVETFSGSDLLVTDCASFLASYLPTQSPVIRLIRADAAPLSTFGQSLAHSHYEARSEDELQSAFDSLLRRGTDPLREARVKRAQELTVESKTSAEKLLAELTEVVRFV